jgi:hypothetical protein
MKKQLKPRTILDCQATRAIWLYMTPDEFGHLRNLAPRDIIAFREGNCMVVICPFCDIVYELQQRRIEKLYEARYNLPVVFYPQLLGLAMELSADEVGLPLNRVKSGKLMEIVRAG